MRFSAVVEVALPDDPIERAPTFWDACKGLLGSRVDLATGLVRSRLEEASFLVQVRRALDDLDVRNARSLVVDGTVVFEDHHGRPDDLADLMLAFADHALVAPAACSQLRLSVEHEEAGLCLEIDASIAVEHPREDPAARVSIVGRLLDLAPRADETPAAYRGRIEAFVADPKRATAARLQFTTFVSRVERALASALPGASLATRIRALEVDSVVADVALAPVEPSVAVRPPPSYAVRLREIEHLREQLVAELAMAERQSLDEVPASVLRGIEHVNRLVREHNRRYPIEHNLPIDPATGELLVGGEPWKPLDPISLEVLRRTTAAMRTRPSG